ncbi:MAG: DUF6559 family protein [Planctomycetota bacterium]
MIFDAWRRKRRLRKMRGEMARELRRRYGAQSAYTPDQIDRTWGDLHFFGADRPYAHAFFGDRTRYTDATPIGDGPTYEEARAEVADTFFHGNEHFAADDVLDGGPGGYDHVDAGDGHGSEGGGSDGGGGDGGGGDGGGSD